MEIKKIGLIVCAIAGVMLLASLILGICSLVKVNNLEDKTVNYKLNVAGISVTDKNAKNVMDGVSYDANENVLTLNNADITGINFGIVSNNDLVIKLVGDNTITVGGEASTIYGIAVGNDYFTNDLIIFGSGTLTINSEDITESSFHGIYADSIEVRCQEINFYADNFFTATAVGCNDFLSTFTTMNIDFSNGTSSTGISTTGSISLYVSTVDINLANCTDSVNGLSSSGNTGVFFCNMNMEMGDSTYITGIQCYGDLLIRGGEGEETQSPQLEHSLRDYENNIVMVLGDALDAITGIEVRGTFIYEGGFLSIVNGNCTNGDNVCIEAKDNVSLGVGEIYAKAGTGKIVSTALDCNGNLLVDINSLILIGGGAEESCGAAVMGHVCLVSGNVRFEGVGAEYISVGLYAKGTLEVIEAGIACWANEVTDAEGESYGTWINGKVENESHVFFATGYTKAMNNEIEVKLTDFSVNYSTSAGNIAAGEITKESNPANFDYSQYKYILIEQNA